MPISYFDQMFHTFACENPKCGKEFKQILRSLLKADEVLCPHCGTAKDIREAKRYPGKIWHDFDTAQQLDIKGKEKK